MIVQLIMAVFHQKFSSRNEHFLSNELFFLFRHEIRQQIIAHCKVSEKISLIKGLSAGLTGTVIRNIAVDLIFLIVSGIFHHNIHGLSGIVSFSCDQMDQSHLECRRVISAVNKSPPGTVIGLTGIHPPAGVAAVMILIVSVKSQLHRTIRAVIKKSPVGDSCFRNQNRLCHDFFHIFHNTING